MYCLLSFPDKIVQNSEVSEPSSNWVIFKEILAGNLTSSGWLEIKNNFPFFKINININ